MGSIKPTITAYGGGTQQFPVFLNRATVGMQFERTERDLAKLISESVKQSPTKTINVVGAAGTQIQNVVGAVKHSNTDALGGDSLLDVSISTRNGKSLKINTKGTIAPVQTHSDFRSVYTSSPIVAKRFARAAIAKYKSLGFKDGDMIPAGTQGIYAEMQGENNMRIVRGVPAMGGPIDYFFEGQPSGQFDAQTGVLTLGATLVTARDLAKQQKFFLSMPPPPAEGTFMFNKQDTFGVPLIHDRGGRSLSITDRSFVDRSSIVVRI